MYQQIAADLIFQPSVPVRFSLLPPSTPRPASPAPFSRLHILFLPCEPLLRNGYLHANHTDVDRQTCCLHTCNINPGIVLQIASNQRPLFLLSGFYASVSARVFPVFAADETKDLKHSSSKLSIVLMRKMFTLR